MDSTLFWSERRCAGGALQQGNAVTSVFGPSGVRALPLADCTNEGGHYFGPSGAVQTVSDSRRPLF